jgi:hypothetical protein
MVSARVFMSLDRASGWQASSLSRRGPRTVTGRPAVNGRRSTGSYTQSVLEMRRFRWLQIPMPSPPVVPLPRHRHPSDASAAPNPAPGCGPKFSPRMARRRCASLEGTMTIQRTTAIPPETQVPRGTQRVPPVLPIDDSSRSILCFISNFSARVLGSFYQVLAI